MVSLLPISSKLRERARRIVMTEACVDYETAAKTLEETGYDIKAAIIMLKAKVDYGKALKALRETGGDLEKALNLVSDGPSSSKPRRG